MSSIEFNSCSSCYVFSQQLACFFHAKRVRMFRHFVNSTSSPSRLTVQFSGNYAVELTSFFAYRKLLPNLINSSWLWWIIRGILANQRRRNIFEWILMIIVIIIISIVITLKWANVRTWERGSDGHFHTNHCSLSTRVSSWCLCLQDCGKGLLRRPRRRFSCEMYLHNYISPTSVISVAILFDLF